MSQSSRHHGSVPLPSSSCPRAEIRVELCLPFSNLSTPGRDSTYRLFLDLGILLGLTELPLSPTASYCSEGGGLGKTWSTPLPCHPPPHPSTRQFLPPRYSGPWGGWQELRFFRTRRILGTALILQGWSHSQIAEFSPLADPS